MFTVSYLLRYFVDSRRGPTLGIRGRVAEHAEKDRLGKHVDLDEGSAALGPQCVPLIQDFCNPLLLGKGRDRNNNLCGSSLSELSSRCASDPRRHVIVFENPTEKS